MYEVNEEALALQDEYPDIAKYLYQVAKNLNSKLRFVNKNQVKMGRKSSRIPRKYRV